MGFSCEISLKFIINRLNRYKIMRNKDESKKRHGFTGSGIELETFSFCGGCFSRSTYWCLCTSLSQSFSYCYEATRVESDTAFHTAHVRNVVPLKWNLKNRKYIVQPINFKTRSWEMLWVLSLYLLNISRFSSTKILRQPQYQGRVPQFIKYRTTGQSKSIRLNVHFHLSRVAKAPKRE